MNVRITPPLNASQNTIQVTVNYTNWSWGTPTDCNWSCDDGYTQDWNRCNSAPHTLTISWANSWDIANGWTEAITLTASATDNEWDTLTYTWSATNATLSSTTWASIDATVSYNWWAVSITVVASDWNLSSWNTNISYTWNDTSYDEDYQFLISSWYNETTYKTQYLWRTQDDNNWAWNQRLDAWQSSSMNGAYRTSSTKQVANWTRWVPPVYETRTRTITQGTYTK